jgi:hypothetical protein
MAEQQQQTGTDSAAERQPQAYPRERFLTEPDALTRQVGQRVTQPMIVGALALLDAETDGKPAAELTRAEMVHAVKAFLKRPDPTGQPDQEAS